MRAGVLPAHVACIMDGNGRWALARGLPRTEGHRAAQHALVALVDAALTLGLPCVSVFAFSVDNWHRPADEVANLLRVNDWLINPTLLRRGTRGDVRFRFIGDRTDLPTATTESFDHAEALSPPNARLTLNVVFNYGGRDEIVLAARRAAQSASAETLTPETFARHLYAPDLPDVDLLIRTSGEQRLSGFLLWHAANAELVFLDTLWPDFRSYHLISAIAEYQRRCRRRGRVSVADELVEQHCTPVVVA